MDPLFTVSCDKKESYLNFCKNDQPYLTICTRFTAFIASVCFGIVGSNPWPTATAGSIGAYIVYAVGCNPEIALASI